MCIAPNRCRCEDGRVKEDCSLEEDYGYLADEPGEILIAIAHYFPIYCKGSLNGK